MKGYQRYKTAILILSILVIIEAIAIILLWATRPKKVPKIATPIIKPRIAIVIDDWGYNLNNLDILDQIKYPLTMSVLPNLNYSRTVSDYLHQKGFEIILHLPMEPREKYRLEKNTLMTSMDEPTIINILKKDLSDVTYTKGVSNHMGSKATEDSRVMEIIFKELKRRNLYFLDNVVSSKSVCSALARKMNLLFSKRDIFLDNQPDLEYTRGQIYKLKTRAKIYGHAIGIGHDRKVTLEVLKEIMPELEKEGYKFVFVSDLVK